MSGNVYEWTCSKYKERYDRSEQKCWDSASRYSLRGGSWYYRPRWVRAAHRFGVNPGDRYNGLGFRLALDK